MHQTKFSLASIKKVTVIGGGLMGSGIAQVIAQHGQSVQLVEVSEASALKCRNRINKSLLKLASKSNDKTEYAENIIKNINFSVNLQESVKFSDLIIEAVAENLQLKQNIFIQAEKSAPDHAIMVTNTSSISVSKIGSVLKNQEKFAGLHFFNPVPMLRLVEVVKAKETSENTHKALLEWSKSIGKVPITAKDTPGFIVNRLLFPLVGEAIRMYERGDAELKDIDTALKLGANHPMGPIELADLVGHDTVSSIIEFFHAAEPDNPLFTPLESQQKLLREGKLGVKTGEGYHKYKVRHVENY